MGRGLAVLVVILLVSAVITGVLLLGAPPGEEVPPGPPPPPPPPPPPEPVQDLTIEIRTNPETAFAPVEVRFSVFVEGGREPYQYSWELGDGTRASTGSVDHIYRNPGTFTVGVTVADADGAVEAKVREYQVLDLAQNPQLIRWIQYDFVTGEATEATDDVFLAVTKTKLELCTWDGTSVAALEDRDAGTTLQIWDVSDPQPGAPPVCNELILSKGVDYDWTHIFGFFVNYIPGSALELGWAIRLYSLSLA